MGQRKNNKNNGLGKIIYIAGTAALVFMLTFSTINFIRDARVLRLPVLSGAVSAGRETNDSEDADYKTITYKKPEATATPKPKSKSPAKKTEAAKPTATPKPTPSPQP